MDGFVMHWNHVRESHEPLLDKGRTISPIVSGRAPRSDGPPFLMSGHRRCWDRVIRTRMRRVYGPGLGVCRDDGRDRSISAPLARRGRGSRRDGEARQGGATPAARSVRLPAWLGGAAFGSARLAVGGTQTTPFSLAQRASVGSTDASASLPARVGVVGPTRATMRWNLARASLVS
jgi:hypothetical protein